MRLIFLLFAALALWGCSSSQGHASYEPSPEAGAPMRLERKSMAKNSMYLEGVNVTEAPQAAEGSAPAAYMTAQATPLEAKPKQASPRLVYYHGGVSLKATQPDAVLDTAEARARALGGYVESRSANQVALRIPVAHFRSFFEMAQTLGVKQNQWMRADDITDAFQDISLRIQIGEATLARLQELLAASTQNEEKLQLLREIRRVSDELEGLKNSQDLLARQAAFSRLELEVQPFVFETGRADLGIDAFGWFAQLQPKRSAEPRLGKKAELELPKGFVSLGLKKAWAARSADGAELWAFQRVNEPRGDGAFWRDALAYSLSRSFAKAQKTEAGPFSLLRLESHGASPYVWYIATQSQGKKLYVAQSYFPDLAAEARHGEAIRQSLAGGVQ